MRRTEHRPRCSLVSRRAHGGGFACPGGEGTGQRRRSDMVLALMVKRHGRPKQSASGVGSSMDASCAGSDTSQTSNGPSGVVAMLRPCFSIALLCATLSLAGPELAFADDRADCASGGGTLLSGVVVTKPSFAGGKSLRGIPLSHTHIQIRGDADGKLYDLAVDDVFAAGYDPQVSAVPSPLSAITVGEHLEACGLPYTGGMHWVHTNCGDAPTAQDPNGWLKVVDATGTVGPNLEDSQKYCYLWPNANSSQGKRRSRPPRSM